ncbi:peptidoglycan N-acetylglucosamine deacetylase [Bacillus toyonensis]|nr:peptidoglycan N-acetylglucosamine deacetylase [Bacillus toyonensis]
MIPPNNSISSGSLFDPNSFQLQNYNRISIVRLSLQALPESIKFYKEQGYEFGIYSDEGHFRLNFQKDQSL